MRQGREAYQAGPLCLVTAREGTSDKVPFPPPWPEGSSPPPSSLTYSSPTTLEQVVVCQ